MTTQTSYEEKKTRVWKEHGEQILGLMLSNPKVQMVLLIKYVPQRDDIMSDTDSPLASWRGYRFLFERKSFEVSLAEMRDRIILIDKMIDAPINPSEFKDGLWVLKDGKLFHQSPEINQKKK